MQDHRKLGRELGLFDTDPLIGAGLPYWLPDGAVVRHTVTCELWADLGPLCSGSRRLAVRRWPRGSSFPWRYRLPTMVWVWCGFPSGYYRCPASPS